MMTTIDYHHPDIWREITDLVFTSNSFRTTGLSGYYECPPEWRWHLTLRDFDLWLVVAGSGTVSIGNLDEVHRVSAGTLLLLRPGDAITAEQDPDHLLTVVAAHFDCFEGGSDRIVTLPDHHIPNRRIDFTDSSTMERLLKRLVRLQDAPWPLASIEESLVLTEALIETYRQDAANHGSRDYTADSRLERVIGRLRQSPQLRMSLAEASAIAGLSPDYFSRLFAAQFGMPFRDYVVRLRLERARHMLEETDLRVAEIARVLGYDDPHLFSRQFRQFFGIAPRQMRQRTY